MNLQSSDVNITLEEGHLSSAQNLLNSRSWPIGLQNALFINMSKMPYRFFICDDSGSMAANDGHRLIGSGSSTKLVPCTRWSELTDSLKFHASLASTLSVPTEFRLLNSHTPLILNNQSQDSYYQLLSMFDQSPTGGTPLCYHIQEVIKKIQPMTSFLRNSGQKAVIIIATDGESSDGDIANAMLPLQHLPVWIIIRLCTDDKRIVNYWNDIDSKLECDMDVIDDYIGESEEIYSHNKWLNYGEPLHRLREWGVHIKDLDMIDECKLSSESMRNIIGLLFNIENCHQNIPHPDLNYDDFILYVNNLLNNNQADITWNPIKRNMQKWIDIVALKRAYGHSDVCTCCLQ